MISICSINMLLKKLKKLMIKNTNKLTNLNFQKLKKEIKLNTLMMLIKY